MMPIILGLSGNRIKNRVKFVNLHKKMRGIFFFLKILTKSALHDILFINLLC